MVAMISGNALGLFNSSSNLHGSSVTGQLRGRTCAKAATGNPVSQIPPDTLPGAAIDSSLLRSYNPQGKLTNDVVGGAREASSTGSQSTGTGAGKTGLETF